MMVCSSSTTTNRSLLLHPPRSSMIHHRRGRWERPPQQHLVNSKVTVPAHNHQLVVFNDIMHSKHNHPNNPLSLH